MDGTLKTNEGGRHDMAIAYLVSLLGPVYEYQNLFDVKNVLLIRRRQALSGIIGRKEYIGGYISAW